MTELFQCTARVNAVRHMSNKGNRTQRRPKSFPSLGYRREFVEHVPRPDTRVEQVYWSWVENKTLQCRNKTSVARRIGVVCIEVKGESAAIILILPL